MKENKSIDGLATRGAKKSTSKSSATKNPKTTKQSIQKAPKTTKSPNTRKIDFNNLTSSTASTNPIQTATTDRTTQVILDDTVLDIIDNSPVETNISTDSTTPSNRQTVEDFLTPVSAFDFDASTGELTATTPSETTDQTNQEDTMTTDSTSTTANVSPSNSPSKTPKTKKSKKSKKKPIKKARKIITGIILFILLSIIGLATGVILWGNDIIAKITGGKGNFFDLFSLASETYEPLKTDSNGRTNILAFGTSGFNMEGDSFDGTHDGASLTDSIMMISLDQNTGDIVMLSLPRDLKVAYTCTNTSKVNEIYWCNNQDDTNEAAGAEALLAEVGYILGVDFQYYAHLNWGSLVSIVDLLGGINIALDEDIEDYYYTGAVFQAGIPYTINGEQALGLARARHGTIGGDFSRGASQQKILIGIKDKVFEKNLSISDLLSLASTLGDNLRTNFSISDFKTLAHLTQVFNLDNIRQISLVDYDTGTYYVTTDMINGISYVIPSAGIGNYYDIQDFVAEKLSNDPLIYEDPTILVLNATETAGLANTESTTLISEGYPYVIADNAPAGNYHPGITIYTTSSKPGTSKLLSSHYNTNVLSADELPPEITRAYDFIIIVNPDTTEDSPDTTS